MPGEYGGFFVKLNGAQRLITYASIHYAGWKLVGLIDQSVLIDSINDSFNWTVWSSIALILLFMALALGLSRQVMRPVKRLPAAHAGGGGGGVSHRVHRRADSGAFRTFDRV